MIHRQLPPPDAHTSRSQRDETSFISPLPRANGGRLNFIDAARGFVMSIVVFQHVRAFGLGLNSGDSALSFVYLYFFLTTFFLLSGFLSGSLLRISSFKELIARISAKFRTLIIPLTLFWIAYNAVATQNESMGRWGFPGGYWFIFTWFLIASIGGIIAYTCKMFKAWQTVIILLVVGFVLQLFRIIYGSNLDTGLLFHLRVRQFCMYFLYFAIGLLMSINKEKMYALMGKHWLRTILIGGTFLLYIFRYAFATKLGGTILSGVDFVISFFATLTVFLIFFLTEKYWDSRSSVARALNLVGRKSLDVYMLHYFFIPSLPVLTPYFTSANNGVIELAVVGAVTILVLIISLLASSILRMAKPLGVLLFGK